MRRSYEVACFARDASLRRQLVTGYCAPSPPCGAWPYNQRVSPLRFPLPARLTENSMLIPRALLAALCLTSLILTGCSKSSNNNQGNAQMRVVNAFSQANALDCQRQRQAGGQRLAVPGEFAVRRRRHRKPDSHRQRYRRLDLAGQYDLQHQRQHQVQLRHLRAADRRRRPAADRCVQRSGRRLFLDAFHQRRRRVRARWISTSPRRAPT